MKELNYQPNEMARSLSKQNNTIGIILPQIEHPYFAKVLGRLEKKEASKRVDIAQLYLFLKIKKNARKNALKCAKAQNWQE